MVYKHICDDCKCRLQNFKPTYSCHERRQVRPTRLMQIYGVDFEIQSQSLRMSAKKVPNLAQGVDGCPRD